MGVCPLNHDDEEEEEEALKGHATKCRANSEEAHEELDRGGGLTDGSRFFFVRCEGFGTLSDFIFLIFFWGGKEGYCVSLLGLLRRRFCRQVLVSVDGNGEETQDCL